MMSFCMWHGMTQTNLLEQALLAHFHRRAVLVRHLLLLRLRWFEGLLGWGGGDRHGDTAVVSFKIVCRGHATGAT
jgi:hypothetical protein